MIRRMMATLWTLPDGTRCDLIVLVPSGWNLLAESRWQLEVIRGADRLNSASFAEIEAAYAAAGAWRSAAERKAYSPLRQMA